VSQRPAALLREGITPIFWGCVPANASAASWASSKSIRTCEKNCARTLEHMQDLVRTLAAGAQHRTELCLRERQPDASGGPHPYSEAPRQNLKLVSGALGQRRLSLLTQALYPAVRSVASSSAPTLRLTPVVCQQVSAGRYAASAAESTARRSERSTAGAGGREGGRRRTTARVPAGPERSRGRWTSKLRVSPRLRQFRTRRPARIPECPNPGAAAHARSPTAAGGPGAAQMAMTQTRCHPGGRAAHSRQVSHPPDATGHAPQARDFARQRAGGLHYPSQAAIK